MRLLRCIILLCLLSFRAVTSVCYAQDSDNAMVGQDFWVALPLNMGTQTPRYYKLIALGDTPCSVTVTHPSSGWSQTASLTASGYLYITLPETYARYTVFGVATENAFHVTSTANISLCVVDNQLASCGITQVLATPSLRSHYMVQDYPGNTNHSSQSSSQVVLVAVEDSTMLSMLLPCMASGCPVGAGNTYTLHLSQGQTCLLSAPAPASFSGMTVTGNKSFALFQGNSLAYIPANSSSGDYIMEQAIPSDFWGMEFLLVSTPSRTMDDIVRVTSLEDNCQIALTDGSLHDTLQCGQTREFTLCSNTVKRLTATKPVCVGIYQPCSDYYGENGDGTQLMIHPLSRGIRQASFKPFESVRIHSHHLTIVTQNEYVAGMTLDGSSVASSFTVIDNNYSFARIQVDSTLHRLSNSLGPFQACVYGHGRVESYAYNLGAPMAPLPCDTIRLYDTICLAQPYEEHGFRITAMQTGIAGDYLFERSTVEDTVRHYYLLFLTVLPVSTADVSQTLHPGDTLYFNGHALTAAGDYRFVLTAANGCDSILFLHLTMEEVIGRLTASADTICIGNSVTLTASGTEPLYHWRAIPDDPQLNALQGQNTIVVRPTVATTYYLCSTTDEVLDSTRVIVEELPVPCLVVETDSVDATLPLARFQDCTANQATTQWSYGDGQESTGAQVTLRFSPPLDDSVWVTMTTCCRHGCCADTTLGLPVFIPEIQPSEVWFPNVFTPEGESNREFRVIGVGVSDFELWIFNRWGENIFHTTDINEGWDGTYRGQLCRKAAYVYRCHCTTTAFPNKTYVGTVLLLR